MESVVPFTPTGVCFKREKFIKEDFSPDLFLQDLWNSVTLEVLRDDLGAYLKVLRSAMIELINRDYADFVNLSGNLVGLDRAIANLQEPLSVIQSEIMMVSKVLNDAHNKLQLTLSERQSLREKKLVLECLMKIPASLDHLEKLLLHITESENISKMIEDDQTKGSVMERAANEFNHLQHLLVKCNSTSSAVEDLQKRTDKVNSSLMKCLEDTLVFGIEEQKKEILQKTLRTFFLLDQCKFAVNLLRIRLIHPAFWKILNQQSLKMEPQDLNGLLTKMKEFIRQKLKDLVEISGSFEGPQGFNLVVDCLWPEFYNALVGNLDCIFAQGNPDLFHKRYTCTMEFINYLESLSSCSSLQSLKNDPNYQLMIGRWNLPVYFQMRFQELAGGLETSLIKPFNELENEEPFPYFKSTKVLLNVLMACYAPDIYLAPLAHRFWKLSLQMMSRHQKKISEILIEQLKRYDAASVGTTSASLVPSNNAKLLDVDSSIISDPNPLTLEQLVRLDSDIRFVLEKLPEIWDLASKRLGFSSLKNQSLFEFAFQTSTDGFEKMLPNISQLIIGELSIQCTSNLRQVADIPRLYRRTNKEAPGKCFGYVNLLLEPIRVFRTRHSDRTESLDSWTRGVLETLSQQYLVAVSDVLTSVQKTEESLKRLRKDRAASASAGVSDDDKIRMQLVIDVDAFVEAAQPILTNVSPLPEIKALLGVVEPARLVFRRTPPT
nr:EOG090X03KZ [Eurycercus lamellatus]